MRRIGIFLIIFFAVNFLNAQTRVLKMSATRSSDYGVTYFLPKTVFTIHVSYDRITQKAGPYARYAEQYLGVREESIVSEDGVYYTLNSISVESKGVIDRDASYLVQFRSGTTASFVCLTEDGLICTINADFVPEPVNNDNRITIPPASGRSTLLPQSVFTEEYLRAGSVTKMAEVAAKQIHRLRESRTDLLTGDADNAPRDGEGMRIAITNLEAQEKAWLELFLGTTSVETLHAEFQIEPLSDINREVLFRFSKYSGIVGTDDLSGSPIYINVTNLENTEMQAEVDPRRRAREPQSIVYNVPGKAEVEVFYGINSMYKNTFSVVQFGNKQILATSLFEDRRAPVKIYFFPETGAIRQIIQ
jgi:hypothetical protein